MCFEVRRSGVETRENVECVGENEVPKVAEGVVFDEGELRCEDEWGEWMGLATVVESNRDRTPESGLREGGSLSASRNGGSSCS